METNWKAAFRCCQSFILVEVCAQKVQICTPQTTCCFQVFPFYFWSKKYLLKAVKTCVFWVLEVFALCSVLQFSLWPTPTTGVCWHIQTVQTWDRSFSQYLQNGEKKNLKLIALQNSLINISKSPNSAKLQNCTNIKKKWYNLDISSEQTFQFQLRKIDFPAHLR